MTSIISRSAGIALALALLTNGAPALAEPSAETGPELLDRARTAEHELDYTSARKLLEASLRTGDHDIASLAELHALAGRVAAAFGQPEQAYEHYRRMLILGVDVALPKGLSPKIVSPFQRARAELQNVDGIAIRVARVTRKRLTVSVASDPLDMVAGAEAVFERQGTQRRVFAKLSGKVAELRVPSRARAQVRLYALDRFGNRLSELAWSADAHREGSAGQPPARAKALDAAPSASRSRPLLSRWQLWGAAAAGAGATALYYGLRANDDWSQLAKILDDSSSHTYEEAKRIEKRGERNKLYSNISTAAAVGLAGVGLYLRLRDSENERSGLGATVSPNGASVSLRMSF